MKNENINDKRAMFLDMQEHPEQYTEEQINNLLADDDVREFAHLMAMSKRAMLHSEQEEVNTEEAWQAFAHEHALVQRNWLKTAASFIGILFLSGIALAAVIQMGLFRPKTEMPTPSKAPQQELAVPADSAKKDIQNPNDSTDMKPIVFEDAELGTILTQMGAFYHVNVTFGKEASRHIRLYFQWDKHLDLQQQIDLLNAFDRINITLQGNSLNVE